MANNRCSEVNIRPVLNPHQLEQAIDRANLSSAEAEIIEEPKQEPAGVEIAAEPEVPQEPVQKEVVEEK